MGWWAHVGTKKYHYHPNCERRTHNLILYIKIIENIVIFYYKHMSSL